MWCGTVRVTPVPLPPPPPTYVPHMIPTPRMIRYERRDNEARPLYLRFTVGAARTLDSIEQISDVPLSLNQSPQSISFFVAIKEEQMTQVIAFTWGLPPGKKPF